MRICVGARLSRCCLSVTMVLFTHRHTGMFSLGPWVECSTFVTGKNMQSLPINESEKHWQIRGGGGLRAEISQFHAFFLKIWQNRTLVLLEGWRLLLREMLDPQLRTLNYYILAQR